MFASPGIYKYLSLVSAGFIGIWKIKIICIHFYYYFAPTLVWALAQYFVFNMLFEQEASRPDSSAV